LKKTSKDSFEESSSNYRNLSFIHNNTFPSFIIQKYMETPYLYKGYKFDIRVYATLTHEMELYVFPESYVRLSSYPYTLDKMNYYIHLTNNAVQSACKGYGALLKGNIFPISELERQAVEEGKQTAPFMQQIKETIRTAFDATFDLLNPNFRAHSFELFGFDFMVDNEFKVWMLECNSGPSLCESNQFLSSLLHRMLDDLFKLTVDKLFPPPENNATFFDENSPYPLLDYPTNKNLWEFVHSYPRPRRIAMK